MQFVLGPSKLGEIREAQKRVFLLANALGGYMTTTTCFSVTRADMGLLNAAYKAPNFRVTTCHRIAEVLKIDRSSATFHPDLLLSTPSCGRQSIYQGSEFILSTQEFADRAPETGYKYLSGFTYEYNPCWIYDISGIHIERQTGLSYERNQVCVKYSITNNSKFACEFQIRPGFKFANKDQALENPISLELNANCLSGNGHALYFHTNGQIEEIKPIWENLAYVDDAKDGRCAAGLSGSCFVIKIRVEARTAGQLELILATEPNFDSADTILQARRDRMQALVVKSGFKDRVARQLAMAADAFIVQRESTEGQTIIAGYPLFADWGRDTMIAILGCCISLKRFTEAKNILTTFLNYERNGLLPNFFPEGQDEPQYNSIDAPLLLINAVYEYYRHTKDLAFLKSAYPTLVNIIENYRHGTLHNIKMMKDGLIAGGTGSEQLTWMDVCIDGYLPTPRHGKAVEINAYWYNALCIMSELAQVSGFDVKDYADLALHVKKSFIEQFYYGEGGYLFDVVNNEPQCTVEVQPKPEPASYMQLKADTEIERVIESQKSSPSIQAESLQIRCNQIFALALPFTMLNKSMQLKVLEVVNNHLYTPAGLRSLSPLDSAYEACYGGSQLARDLAYHQGTVWVYPLGSFYRAYLKLHDYSKVAALTIKNKLNFLATYLDTGCLGQLPEIYDGDIQLNGKGCFAQAWSVGEIIRVYEEVEMILSASEVSEVDLR